MEDPLKEVQENGDDQYPDGDDVFTLPKTTPSMTSPNLPQAIKAIGPKAEKQKPFPKPIKFVGITDDSATAEAEPEKSDEGISSASPDAVKSIKDADNQDQRRSSTSSPTDNSCGKNNDANLHETIEKQDTDSEKNNQPSIVNFLNDLDKTSDDSKIDFIDDTPVDKIS